MNDLVPSEFYLGQNYPNPFKEKTIIKYCIAYKTRVKLTVYNSEGEEIEKLVDEEKKPGTYEVEFQSAVSSLPDGLSADKAGKTGRQLAIGSYCYRLEAGEFISEKKMVLEK